MFKDLFVSNDIKKLYSKKPMSVKAFIKSFERISGITVNDEIKSVFKELYQDSYTTTKQYLNIIGPKSSGKSLLSMMIAIYDAVRQSCLVIPYKFSIVIVDQKYNNPTARALKTYLREYLYSPYADVVTITPQTKHELLGIDIGSCIVDDYKDFDTEITVFTDYQRSALRNSHYIETHELDYPVNSNLKPHEKSMIIYLKGQPKV